MRRLPGVADSLPLPFPTHPYTPPWIRAGTTLERLGDPLDARTPALFVVPSYMARDSVANARRRAADPALATASAHPLGVHRLTRVRLTLPDRSRSEAVAALARSGVLDVAPGTEPLLELTFDGGGRGRRDLRPDLPLILRY